MEMSVGNGFDWGGALRKLAWGGAAFLLLLPLVAMQFTAEVNWGPGDFIVMGAMLFGCAGLVHLATRRTDNPAYLFGAVIAVGTAFVLIWVNLAVGIIGDEDNAANLMFMGVILIAAIGAVIARFQARGMANAMFAAAFAQGLAAAATLYMGWGLFEPPGAAGVLAIILFFAAMWLLAGGLFLRAARDGRTEA
jgi:hypothetical protein